MSNYPSLLSPITIGPLALRNRVVSTSHQTMLVHDHLPTDDLVAYHEARAAGGVGAIFLEATAVHPTGLLTAHTLGGYLPGIVAGYRRLVDAAARHDTRVFVQLFHGGREQIIAAPRAPAVAPSAVPSARLKSEPRALTVREIREIVDGYATAAGLAREGAVDGIELSFAHGYLVAQFFSPTSNRRADDYNGGLESRLRLAREIIAAVRAAAGPGLAVGVRLAANELAPSQLDADACAEIAGALCGDGGLDFVSFALGHSATYSGSTWIAPPAPVAENAIAREIGTARARVGATPVIATTRIVDLDDAERIVAAGTADLVGMTRALIADPDLVTKATDHRREPIIECIGCNQACIGHYHAGIPIGCAVNVRTGRERVLPRPRTQHTRRRVLVIGGGPAGVSAALEAAAWGDEVTLHERATAIGGQLRLAGRAPAHTEVWGRWLSMAKRQLQYRRVTVELDSEVGESLDSRSWDLIVLATGARPYRPELPDVEVDVVDAWEAIADPGAVNGPVLVADLGAEWTGLDAAEVLSAAGHEVILASAATHPGETLHQYQRNLYLARLDEAGISIIHHSELAVINGGLAMRHVFSGRHTPLPPARSLVLAHGRVPNDPLWASLECHENARRAGDVLGPRSLEEAILEGALTTGRGNHQGLPVGTTALLQDAVA
jgi:2,4-dienoyl-CoA reductase-like NADH-dependent reductase (Old Yellow Enzyme family)/thioredoxin reductase